jgi:thioredoxin-like negative regulator of GroEL
VTPADNGQPRKPSIERTSARPSPKAGLPAAAERLPVAAPPVPEAVPDFASDLGESEPTTVHNPTARVVRESLPDTYDPFARRKAPGWVWAFVIVTTVLGFGTWLLWPMFDKPRAPIDASNTDPAIQFLARADAAFATHREQRFEEALTDYVKALAFHESDPHVLSSISRVYGVWAQELLTRADTLAKANSGDADVERRSQLLALNKQARELGEQAKRYAENAARKNPGNEEAEVALADALRLTGNLVSARSELDRAQNNESSPSGETLRVAALLAIAEAGGDLRKGLPLASQAVAQDPDLLRARLLLARCLIADGDYQGARYHLAAVATKDRSHPGVLALEQMLARPPSVPDAPQAKSDAGPPKEAVDDSSSAQRADKDKDRDSKDKDKDKEDGFDNLSHEAYIARGQKMLESGQVTNAKRMFEQALFIRPSSAEAHLGLGFVAIEKGRTKLAVEHFQEAKKDGNAEALIGLGEAYRRMNRPREALRAYQSYVADHPRGPQIGIAKAQVERLTEEASAGKK